jgi:transcriptional regulator with XRE-family HTH domain
VRAAGEVAPQPLWVLDSPLLRRALAEVNVPAVIAIVRAACGLSQQDMAVVAGWSRSALSCYERGRRDAVFDVRALLQFTDAVEMPRAALLALVLADPDATTDDEVGIASTGLVPGDSARHPSGSRLRYWRACTDALHERDRQAGGTALLRPALLLLRAASPGTVGAGAASSEWLVTAAGIALYAARAALDAGDTAQAYSLHEAARDLAAGVRDDLMLSAHVLLAGSLLRAGASRAGGSREPARQALLLAREAAEEARYEPVPQLHALIAIGHAQAAALLGDQPVFDAAITRARRELRRHPHDATILAPAWLRHVSDADITAAEAMGLHHLGRTDRSLTLYRQVLSQADCPRDRATAACELAHALARHGDKAEAIATISGVALPVLESGVTSIRCLDTLHHAVTAVGAIRGALELRDRMGALQQAIPGARATGTLTRPTLATVPA